MDIDATAAAIAAKYAALTPPTGYQAVRLATADLPQHLTPGRGSDTVKPRPVVLVFPDQATLIPGSGQQRVTDARFLVRFYYAVQRDLARETNALRKWLTVLQDAHKQGLTLGGTVTYCRTVGWRIGTLRYADRDYSGVELQVAVGAAEPWSPTA